MIPYRGAKLGRVSTETVIGTTIGTSINASRIAIRSMCLRHRHTPMTINAIMAMKTGTDPLNVQYDRAMSSNVAFFTQNDVFTCRVHSTAVGIHAANNAMIATLST